VTRITIVTASYNASQTIEGAIASVRGQTHDQIEHIVIDGGSTDGTAEIVARHTDHLAYWVSEKDKGLYAALNKGLRVATGDYVGTLGADDELADPDVIAAIARECERTGCDCCYGDLIIVDSQRPDRVTRRWRSGSYRPGKFRWGWMPPHLALFIRRDLFEKLGGYRLDMRISADYELMLRFIHGNNLTCAYVPKTIVRMRAGGLSSRGLGSRIRQFREDVRAWKVNGYSWGVVSVILKKLAKLRQFMA